MSLHRALLVMVWLTLPGAAGAADYVIIRNAQVARTTMTGQEVKLVFSGRVRGWPSGARVQLVMSDAESPSVSWLAEHYFQVSAKTLQTKIRQQVFKGDLVAPVRASSDQECAAKVASTEGGVGVVSADTPLPPGAVKVEVKGE
jgi:hypothetical protein